MHRRLILIARDSRLALGLAVASGALAGLCGLAQAYAISATVDGVFLAHQSIAQVWAWLRILLGVLFVRALSAFVYELTTHETSIGLKSSLREMLFQKLLALGPAHSRGERTGELTAMAGDGIEALDGYFSQYLPQLAISVIVPVTILLIVFPIDPLSGLILLLTAPLIPFFMYMIGRSAETATQRQYESLGRLSSHFLDSLQGLTTLKLFGQSKAQVRNVAIVCDQFRQSTLKVLQVSFLSAFALELLATISTAVIAVEVGLRLLYAQMQFREALFLLILAPEFYAPLRLLGTRFHAGMAGTAAARRLFHVLDVPAPEVNLPSLLSAKAAEGPSRQAGHHPGEYAVEFVDVSCTYPGREAPAVGSVNLSIAAGQHVALVGPSGAGKTTLTSLLLRFIRPTAGCILVNGHALDDFEPDEYRRLVAWVPQNPHLFHDTIGANIRLGKPEATQRETEAAARAAHLDDFIESLPKKYDAPVGEGGARLSSGQAQRLALARAFLLDSPCLILDEPSSSLDPENETLLEDSLGQLTVGRTVITIAHRLNTVIRADLIFAMEQGRLVEHGTHQQLLQSGGAYARLWRAGSPSLEVGEGTPAVVNAAPKVAAAGALSGIVGAATLPLTHWPAEAGAVANLKAVSVASVVQRLLKFVGGEWPRVWLSVLLGALTVGSSVSLMGTSAWLISTAALHPSIATLGVAIVGVRFFGLSRAVFRYLERLASHGVTFRVLRNIRVWFYATLEPLAPARLIEQRAGDLLARATADVETLESMYVRLLAPPLTAILVGIACCGFFVFLHLPQIALILATFFVVVGLALPWGVGIAGRAAEPRLVDIRAALYAEFVDGIQGLADILAFGRGEDRLSRITNIDREYAAAQRRGARVAGVQAGLSLFLPGAAMWLTLILASHATAVAEISGAMLASTALIALAAFEAVTPLPAAAQLWPATLQAARRLFEIADAKPAVSEPPAASGGRSSQFARRAPRETRRSPPALELLDVTFRYPGEIRPAVSHVSFKLDSGRSLGIVGPSGAGKSTLGYLVLRFWDYQSGEIRLDGTTLKRWSSDAVHEQVGYASAQTHLFDTSIYENLRLARRGSTRSEIEAAARQAQIHDFICGLPHGYDTLIGEYGSHLSAGERQRLAIARLLLKDAPFWILDEPTAHLDRATEAQLLSNLFGLMRQRTVLLITHRLVGLENLDEILVMSAGRMLQQGTHAALSRGDGPYQRLWSLQNRWKEAPA